MAFTILTAGEHGGEVAPFDIMLNMSRRLRIACMLAIALTVAACMRSGSQSANASSAFDSGKHGKKKTRERIGEMATRADMDVAASGCDSALWQHVYNPQRLSVISFCTTATGTISDPRPDDDGDMHANLMLDPGQESMVNKRNQKKKGGGLVIEIVCSVQPQSPKAAIQICQGYHAALTMPAAGAHVRVTGTHVIDTHNGWTEIHPVSRIDALK
ncbi:MAG TPA: hypothetical protein VFP26_14495 [Gemmatimonadaceae bacterium]|jgi:hypothetical protein|nr:hypothetical protein [Gemmatimonadaceae bacterium]